MRKSMKAQWSRREWLVHGPSAVLAGTAAARLPDSAANEPVNGEPFRYCLNTSTIQGQKLDLVEVVEIAAKAGYQAIEPWVAELDRYAKSGGSLRDLSRRIKDRGLTVASAIAFFEWGVDDPGRRRVGLDDARRAMELVQKLGGTRIAAPPAGMTPGVDLLQAAERYRTLLKLGDQLGVVPQVEFWGFSGALGRLGQAALVALESGHPHACILPDVYHLYKGGSASRGLRLLSKDALHVLHFNDYPGDPPRATIADANRVYPGDGVAPLGDIVRDLRHIGFSGVLSLELFNRSYWKQDPLVVARTGLAKMRSAVRTSLV
jgi:sugar phosphate isomerase/epimerase